MPAEMEPARFMVARDRSSRSPGEEVVRLEHGREQLLQSLGGRIADFFKTVDTKGSFVVTLVLKMLIYVQ